MSPSPPHGYYRQVRPANHSAILLALGVLWGCEARVDEHEPETARAYFERYVIPELSWRCTSGPCHGKPLDEYTKEGPGWFKLAVDANGAIHSEDARRIAYEEASGTVEVAVHPSDGPGTIKLKRASAAYRIDRHAPAVFSDLVRKMIPVSLGGLPHRGGDNYVSLQDPRLARILAWIEMEQSAEALEFTPLQAQFRDVIQPALARRGCYVSSCHGRMVGNMLKLDGDIGGVFSDATTLHNYKVTLKFLNLNTVDPDESRLLKKILSPAQGGIIHRGSNEFFMSEDAEDLLAIRQWIRQEQAAVNKEGTARGVVYVRRPPALRDLFDVGAWNPGADLWSLMPATADGIRTNLSAAHHSGAADIRTPEVSPDATRIAFAMRKSVEDCLNIYTMRPDGTDLMQLTDDTGCQAASFSASHANAANLSPIYAPDGKIYFVSTRGGLLADKGKFPDTNIWTMNWDGSEQKQHTLGNGHEIDLSIASKLGKAMLVFTAPRDISLKRQGALYFVPTNWWGDYHPMFGEQSKYPIFAQPNELTDLRTVITLQHWDGYYQGGALAIFDRNMGPDLENPEDIAKAAIPAYVRAMNVMSDDAVALGTGSGILWRDPAGLPDGNLVASRTTFELNPLTRTSSTGTTAVTYDLVYAHVEASTTSRQPELQSVDVLVHEAGYWHIEAAPIYERKQASAGTTYIRNNLPSGKGMVQFYDTFMLESVLRDARPTGRDGKIRTDISSLQIMFGETLSPLDAYPIDTSNVRNHDPASTRVSNGIHGRRWVATPVPIEADGSALFWMPAEEQFFLQTVNDDGMAVGMRFDRWQFLGDGEAFGNGVRPATYNTICGGCHGSFSGVPEESFGGVDLLTSASVTLATHIDDDTRREPFDATDRTLLRSVSFKSDLQPLLDEKCATSGCHVGAPPAGDLDLSADLAGAYAGPWSNNYESLMKLGTGSGMGLAGPWQKEYVDERNARAIHSYLAEKILDRELQAPRELTQGGCTAASALSEAQKGQIVLWIETGATYLGKGDL